MERSAAALALLVCAYLLPLVVAEEAKKKNILDYNDVDVERIFQEWEVRTIKNTDTWQCYFR